MKTRENILKQLTKKLNGNRKLAEQLLQPIIIDETSTAPVASKKERRTTARLKKKYTKK